MDPAPPLLLSASGDGVLRLTLNRPERRNALSAELIAALTAALQGAASDGATRVIVIAGAGSAFCAGHDLKELQALRAEPDRGAAAYASLFGACSAMMQAIVNHPKPVIAMVQGVATAAGCQLVASCDLAVASTAARFATPGVDIGLFCSTPMVALSRNVGRKAAMRMLLTGETIDAEEARRIGLVSSVVSSDLLEAETLSLAGTIAAKPRRSLAAGKQAFHRQIEMPLADAYAHASRIMTEHMLNAEAQEGIGAFLDKREPNWPD